MKFKTNFSFFQSFLSYFFLLLLSTDLGQGNNFWITGYVKFLKWNKSCLNEKNCNESKFQLVLYPSNDTIINRVDFSNILNFTNENKNFFSLYFENASTNELSISSSILGINSLYNITTICDISNTVQSFWSLSANFNAANVILKGNCFKASVVMEKKLQECLWCTETTTIDSNFTKSQYLYLPLYFSFERFMVILLIIVSIFFAILTTLLILLIKQKLANNICLSMKDYKIHNYNITMTTNSIPKPIYKPDLYDFKNSYHRKTKQNVHLKHINSNLESGYAKTSGHHKIATSLPKSFNSTTKNCYNDFVPNNEQLLSNIKLNESMKSTNSRIQTWMNYREMWNTKKLCYTPSARQSDADTSLFGGAVGYSETPTSKVNTLCKYNHC